MRSFLHNLLRGGEEPVAINDLDHFCLGESDSRWYTRHFEGVLRTAREEEIARIRPKGQSDMTRVFPDTVFVKTHNFLGEKHGVTLHNMEVTAGAIYIVRNPLDVALSMTHHFGTDVDAAIDRLGHEGAITDMSDTHIPEYHASWSTHVSSWTARENRSLLVMRYEDMLAKPRREFRRVSNFLGLKPSRDRLDRAIRNSSFKTLQSQERRNDFKERSEHSKAFFRTGKEGQWKSVLDSEQITRIVERHSEQMHRFGYLPRKRKK